MQASVPFNHHKLGNQSHQKHRPGQTDRHTDKTEVRELVESRPMRFKNGARVEILCPWGKWEPGRVYNQAGLIDDKPTVRVSLDRGIPITNILADSDNIREVSDEQRIPED